MPPKQQQEKSREEEISDRFVALLPQWDPKYSLWLHLQNSKMYQDLKAQRAFKDAQHKSWGPQNSARTLKSYYSTE